MRIGLLAIFLLGAFLFAPASVAQEPEEAVYEEETVADVCPYPTTIENPWCFNFTRGDHIFDAPREFCAYFDCIANFWNGRGYVIQCRDSMFSKSGGIRGSCSRHGGNSRALLAP